MRVRVMRDLVPAGDDRANQIRVGEGVFTDDEECRACVVRGKEFEDLRGVAGIGTVIDCEPHLVTLSDKTPR